MNRREVELEFRREFDALAGARQQFWETLRFSYEVWKRSEPDSPQEIEQLLDGLPPPSGLPVPEGENLLTWASEADERLDGMALLMWRFAQEIYPPRAPTSSVPPQSAVVPPDSFEVFHSARGSLAKFFRRLGAAALETQTVNEDVLSDYFPTQLRLTKTLSYLEPALVMRTQDVGPGKSELFSLCRAQST